RIPRFRLYNILAYRKAIKAFFREHHEFAAVHGHITSSAAIYLPLAKKAGIPVTIAHSRIAGVEPGIKGPLTRLMQSKLYKRADYLLACSRLAGIDVFGRPVQEAGLVRYLPNAIHTARFDYDETVRENMRDRLGVNGSFVIGHVGRFEHQKNHGYLFRVFCEVQKKIPAARLLLVGDGSGRARLEAQAKELGIYEKTVFAGSVDNPWDYYQAMDFFVFPSHYEGLPGSVVEAQTSGLKCLISDTIAEEVRVTELVTAMSISEEPQKWAEHIIRAKEYPRQSQAAKMRAAGFDAAKQARTMQDFYLQLPNSKPRPRLMLIVPGLWQGGFERICVTTARLLRPHCEVAVVVFDSRDIAYDVEGLPIIDLKRGVKQGALTKAVNVFARAAKLKRLKKMLQTDVAYSFGMTANLANAFSRTKKTKTWLSSHSYMDIAEKSKLRLLARRCDLFLCCSEFIASIIRADYRCPQAVALYNPHDVAQMQRLAAEGEPELPWPEGEMSPCLVTMGREDDIKGYWHTIKVFALVHKEYPTAKLMIIGPGEFAEYRQLAEELGLAAAVCFAGMQKTPFCYLKKGTVYLLTSLKEGFPNALIEAMALGLAAVSCDCPSGPAEILREQGGSMVGRHDIYSRDRAIWGEYGVLTVPMETEKNLAADVVTEAERGMAEAVAKLLADPPLLEKYQQAAVRRAGVFTCEKYVNQILTWLGEI
ncbi:MAG: glycosyltransferase, partial [Lachnospiraceae bacterium]|nr:glycosyltransferase [Lachnospiraceae bacterium]